MSARFNAMIKFLKTYAGTLLFFALVGIFGGFFTGIFVLESYPEDLRAQLLKEISALGLGDLSPDIVMGIITALQSAGYGLFLGAIGIAVAKKIGLWRDERSITAKPLLVSALVSVIGGLAMILPDMLFFGKHSEAIMNSYASKPSIPFILASVTYGAVIEEVMLRLFFMSLIAFILKWIFERDRDLPSAAVFVVANVISALLFAAGHLPATLTMIGGSPLIIARCFILNGGIGLMFGYLYRKYGLRYAMIAHGGCHVVSKFIWLLFI